MAKRKDTGLKDLEKEITCAICHEHYTDPKVLSCCHYYCKQCILSLAKKTGVGKPFSCPECRKDTTLPQGGIDKFQGAFFVNRLKQVHSNLELATGEVEANCEICFEDKATAFCRQCAKFICAECVKSHKRMKMIFPDHKITTLEALKEGGAKEIVTPEPTFQTCQMHEEKMKLFCFDCGCLICRDCTIKDHHSHNYEFVKKAAAEIKKQLSQHLQPLKGVKKDLLSAVKEVQTAKSKLEAKGHSMVRGVEKWCDELCQIIQHHKKQLVAEVKNKISQKTGSLTGQEKGLSISCAGADSVIEFTQHCMEHSTDDEIMCMNAELKSRIDKEIEEHHTTSLKPVEEDDVALEVGGTTELKRLCQTKARIMGIKQAQSLPVGRPHPGRHYSGPPPPCPTPQDPTPQGHRPPGPTPRSHLSSGHPLPGLTLEGPTPQDPTPQGHRPPGPTPRSHLSSGHPPSGLTLEGPTPQDPTPQGHRPPGPTPRGHLSSGHPPPGLTLEGPTPQDPTPQGHRPPGPTPRGHLSSGHPPPGLTLEGPTPQDPTPQGHRPPGPTPRSHLSSGHPPPGLTLEGPTPQDPIYSSRSSSSRSYSSKSSFFRSSSSRSYS